MTRHPSVTTDIPYVRDDIRGAITHVQDDQKGLHRMRHRSAAPELISLDPFAVPGNLLANFTVRDVFVVLEFASVDESLELVRVDIRGYDTAGAAETAIVRYEDLELPLRRMRDASLRAHREIARWLAEESEADLPEGSSDSESEEGSLPRRSLEVAVDHVDAGERATTAAERKVPITEELCRQVAAMYEEILTSSKTPPRAVNAEIAERLGISLGRVHRAVYKARHVYGYLPQTERGVPRA